MTSVDGSSDIALNPLAEPTKQVKSGFILALSIANLAIWAAFFTPLQNLLPRMTEIISGSSGKETSLAIVAGVGAFVAIVANPLAGALSDRTTSRFGRRRPWVLGGAVIGAGAIAALSSQTTVVGLALVWVVAQAAINSAFAGLTAAIPDQVPVRARGAVSGWVGLAQSLGLVVGIGLVTIVITDLTTGTYATAVLYLVLVLPFVFLLKDARLLKDRRPDFDLGQFLKGFWVSPKQNPDFAWAWGARFFVSLGNATAVIYLLYLLQDELKYPDPAQGQLILVVVYTLGIVATAVVFGKLSDRSGKRKIFVIIATIIMAIAALILAVAPNFGVAVLAAAILGLGYGAYLAVDAALITQVLPSAEDRARDLGVINIANSAPQVIAPVIAAPIVTSLGGYPVLYIVTAVITLIGAVLVRPIKSVR